MQKLEVSARRSAMIKGVDSRNHSRRREHEAFVPLDLLAFLTSEVRSAVSRPYPSQRVRS